MPPRRLLAAGLTSDSGLSRASDASRAADPQQPRPLRSRDDPAPAPAPQPAPPPPVAAASEPSAAAPGGVGCRGNGARGAKGGTATSPAVGDTRREGRAPGHRRHGGDTGGRGVRAAAVRPRASSATCPRSVAAAPAPGEAGTPAAAARRPCRAPGSHVRAGRARPGTPGRRAAVCVRPGARRRPAGCAASLS